MRVRVLVIIGLAVLVLGAIATARLTDLPDTPVWAVVATAGLGLLTTLVTDVLSARMQSINERRRDLARQCIGGEAGQLPRVAEVTDLLPLGVRATRLTEAGSDQLTMPGYIQRDADVELDRLIGHGGLIIAAGPSSSGRTRSLFEAVRRVYPDRLLVAPIDVTSLTAMLAIGIPYRRCVVWLGRLDRYTADNGLGVYSLIQSARRGRRPGVVVATWDPSSEAVVDGNDLLSETLRSARTVHYSIDWTAAELARARQDAKTGSALAVALERMGNGTQLVVALLGTEPSSAPNPYLLPPSPRCLGRDVQIAEVAASLANASAVCVLGAPGIGKATVLRAALHDAGVSKMYGPRRIFVQCEGSTSAQNVIAEIALALRLPLGNDLLGRLLTELATRPTAVVLSGIGDPWERDTVRIEDLLSRLAGVPGVGLAVSVRGAAAPLGVSWAHQIRLRRLDHQTAREVFLAVAGEGFRSDPYLNDLVAAQDGVPLAIELLAFSAQAEPDLSSL